MTNKNTNPIDSTSLNSGEGESIRELKAQLQHTQELLEQQKNDNLKLKEKMIFQEKLNAQLSKFHLTTFFQSKESKSLSAQQEEELNKAQEHILVLGNMLLKNKHTISKLKKSKIKDETLTNQITELINEKNFLWNLVFQLHEHLSQIPHSEEDSKYVKAKELIELVKNIDKNTMTIKKKLKP